MLARTIIGTLKYPTDFRKSLFCTGQAILTCYKLVFFFFFFNWNKMLGGQEGSVWIGATGKCFRKVWPFPDPWSLRSCWGGISTWGLGWSAWQSRTLSSSFTVWSGGRKIRGGECSNTPLSPAPVRKMLSEIPPLCLSSSMTKFLSLSFPVCEMGIMMVLAS